MTDNSVLEIVKKHLVDNGFDGLYNADSECACEINDLRPCDDDMSYCKPGYKHTGDSENDFYIKDNKCAE